MTAGTAIAGATVRGKLKSHAPLAPLLWFKSGGPAETLFEPADRDDLVAFLRALPGLIPAEYAALVGPPKRDGPLPAGCAGCHGPEGRGGGPTVPILAGQHEPYLRASLAAFSSGHRASGFMALPTADLAADQRAAIARRMAALAPPEPAAADERLRAAGARSREALEAALGPALAAITAQDARGWFRLAGCPAAD